MEAKCASLAALLTLEDCEYLVRNKLLADQPPAVVSNIIRDHEVDAVNANIALLMKWCQLKPQQANPDTLYKCLAEVNAEGRDVKEALLFLKPSTGRF